MQKLPLVDDIFVEIFSYLDPGLCKSPEEVQLLQATLTSSARTCRALHVHSAKVLWKGLPSDRPLASLLLTLGLAQRSSEEPELITLVSELQLSW